MEYKIALDTLINNGQIPSEDLDSLINYMLTNIGHINSYLRDQLIYQGFCQLILNNKTNAIQEEHILNVCIDEHHLFLNIHHHQNNDDVFTRSFSALVVALLLYKDRTNRTLSELLVLKAVERSLLYLHYENDYRGYIKEKGWAHAVAHGSDLLTQAILHPFANKYDFIQLSLESLRSCLLTDYAYVDDEEERMLPVLDALLEKGLLDEQLLRWLKGLILSEDHDTYAVHRKKWNLKKFSLTLYLHLINTNKCPQTSSWIHNQYYVSAT